MVLEYRVGGVEFWVYHVWLWGEIRTSLPMTWLISSAKSFMLMTTTTLHLRRFQMRCRNQKMVIVGYQRESFAWGDQNIYTIPMQLSKILLRGGYEYDKVGAF